MQARSRLPLGVGTRGCVSDGGRHLDAKHAAAYLLSAGIGPTIAPIPPPQPEPMVISRMLLQTIHGRRSPPVRASLDQVAPAARRCSRCGCAAPCLARGRVTRPAR